MKKTFNPTRRVKAQGTGLAACPLCSSTDVQSYYDQIRYVGYVRCGGDFPRKDCPLRVDVSIGPTNNTPEKAQAAAEQAWNNAAAVLAARQAVDLDEFLPAVFGLEVAANFQTDKDTAMRMRETATKLHAVIRRAKVQS